MNISSRGSLGDDMASPRFPPWAEPLLNPLPPIWTRVKSGSFYFELLFIVQIGFMGISYGPRFLPLSILGKRAEISHSGPALTFKVTFDICFIIVTVFVDKYLQTHSQKTDTLK